MLNQNKANKRIIQIIQNQNSRSYDTFVENVTEYEYNNALEFWQEAQKELLEELSNVIIENEDKLLRPIIKTKLKMLTKENNSKTGDKK